MGTAPSSARYISAPRVRLRNRASTWLSSTWLPSRCCGVHCHWAHRSWHYFRDGTRTMHWKIAGSWPQHILVRPGPAFWGAACPLLTSRGTRTYTSVRLEDL